MYDAYAETGRPSIDPVVIFKLQLILFFEGLRSGRQFLRVVHDRLSLRWYLGYDLGEALSDHSSLTRIQERYGLEVFRRFKAVVEQCVAEQCVAAGLVWGHEVFIDAAKIAVNAALDSLHPRFAVEAISRASSPRRRMTATMAREAVQPGKVATNRRCCQSP